MPLNFDPQKEKAPTTKLEGYSLLASAILLTAGASNAAVVYTDLSPDSLLMNELVGIDFDGDGLDDFSFRHLSIGTGSVSTLRAVNVFFSGEDKGILLDTVAPYLFKATAPLEFGDAIDASKCFFSGTDYYGTGPFGAGMLGQYFRTLSVTTSFGPFLGLSDKFLGVKFPIGGNVHFGWFRLSIPADGSSLTIKDYAFEDLPGVGIAAGAGIVGSTCSTALAPDNLTATVGGGAVGFTWDSIPLSVGCQVSAGPVGTGFPFARNISGASPTSVGPIPLGGVPPGLYEARVRCVCSISPLAATPFSDTVLFTVPAPSPRFEEGAESESLPGLEWTLGPNPVTDVLQVRLSIASREAVRVRIFGVDGREIYLRRHDLERGGYALDFDVSAFETGLYIFQVESGGQIFAEKFEVNR